MKKCIHGVKIPTDLEEGNISPYCSGCCTPEPLPPGAQLTDVVSDPLPYKKKQCPKCGSKKFQYRDDWDYNCPKCGFSALD